MKIRIAQLNFPFYFLFSSLSFVFTPLYLTLSCLMSSHLISRILFHLIAYILFFIFLFYRKTLNFVSPLLSSPLLSSPLLSSPLLSSPLLFSPPISSPLLSSPLLSSPLLSSPLLSFHLLTSPHISLHSPLLPHRDVFIKVMLRYTPSLSSERADLIMAEILSDLNSDCTDKSAHTENERESGS